MVLIIVRDNDVDRALRMLKKLLQNDGFFRRMRLMRYHEKACQKRLREKEESMRRIRKLNRKRMERCGY